MTMGSVTIISASGNALLKELRRLAHSNTDYRKQGRFWAEGEHLAQAALARGAAPALAVFSETFWAKAPVRYAQAATKTVIISDALFAGLSALESPAQMGFVFDLSSAPTLDAHVPSVILDRVQDAGNVGSILRCASGFGFKQVIALKGTAALWSPKVLRAAMGAHWGLQLIEGLDPADLAPLTLPILATSSHRGKFLHQLIQNNELPELCSWAFGHEGQGICSALEALANVPVRIAQPGGEESLNVAAAAAICLHSSMVIPFPDRCNVDSAAARHGVVSARA